MSYHFKSRRLRWIYRIGPLFLVPLWGRTLSFAIPWYFIPTNIFALVGSTYMCVMAWRDRPSTEDEQQ